MERFTNQIICGDALQTLRQLPDESVQCCVTSPPYWGLRDYGVDGQIGLESTPEEYVSGIVEAFREVRRVLKADGTLWLNLGDSYAANRSYQVTDNKHTDVGNAKGMRCGSSRADGVVDGKSIRNRDGCLCPKNLKPKDLIGIPWRVAFALQADGWYLRQDIIWNKPSPMPESVTDRCTKAHEYLFLLTKSKKYYYDSNAIKERSGNGKPGHRNPRPGIDVNGGSQQTGTIPTSEIRNKRSVWTISTHPFPEAHFATFPPDLVKPCILAGTKIGDLVLDPFGGSGTVAVVAKNLGRNYCLIELNPTYIEMAEKRIGRECSQLNLFIPLPNPSNLPSEALSGTEPYPTVPRSEKGAQNKVESES